MIQRIQTIWLFLVAICGVLLFILPFGHELISNVDTQLSAASDQIIMILAICLIAISTLSIFLFKNRNIQKKTSILTVLVSIACLAYILYLTEIDPIHHIKLNLGIILPVLALLFSILAYLGINKDDKTIKSLDRLR